MKEITLKIPEKKLFFLQSFLPN